MPPLLELSNLRVDLRLGADWKRIVDGVSLEIRTGEIVCLVGESGCGKSVTAQTITRLLPATRISPGGIRVEGRDVAAMTQTELRSIRGKVIGHIFQEPAVALNPLMRVGSQIRESLALHRPDSNTDAEAIRLLKQVGVPAPELRMREYPHRLSGGTQQRVMIAMALAAEPKLLVADEPTTALDVTIQAQILGLFRELRDRSGMAVLLITHNFGVVAELADRVAVMYAGQIVETGPVQEVLSNAAHPYTRALLRALPDFVPAGTPLETIPGSVPVPGAWPPGCRFAPRCPVARPTCHREAPTLADFAGNRQTRCPWEVPAP